VSAIAFVLVYAVKCVNSFARRQHVFDIAATQNREIYNQPVFSDRV